ncbi:MAG: hypothetical protein ACREC5_07100, partial [Thermoplasmata archaeon]
PPVGRARMGGHGPPGGGVVDRASRGRPRADRRCDSLANDPGEIGPLTSASWSAPLIDPPGRACWNCEFENPPGSRYCTRRAVPLRRPLPR